MKKPLYQRVLRNLTFWVLLAILAGVLLGHLAPATAVRMEIIGKTFIDIIKLFIGPIIFLTIVLGIAGMGDLKKVGRIGIKALLYFEIVTTFALIIGVLVAYVLQPGLVDKALLPAGDASTFTINASKGFSWWTFFKANFSLQVLVAAIICGLVLNFLRRRQRILEILHQASYYVFTGLKWVMYLAPLGAFGGMAFTIGKFGLHTLVPLAKLVGAVYLTMLLFVFGVLGAIMWYFGQSIRTFLNAIREELL